jgi:hypothetical protein
MNLDLAPTKAASRWVHLLVAVLLVAAGGLAITGATALVAPAPAHALCSNQLEGTWRNIDPNTRAMTRVDLRMYTCGDTPGTQTTYRLRAFGKCHPTDCDWGERITTYMGDNWQRAVYQHSWATKYVWVKPYVFSGRTYLRVWVYTDFTPADGRADYTTDEWMLK